MASSNISNQEISASNHLVSVEVVISEPLTDNLKSVHLTTPKLKQSNTLSKSAKKIKKSKELMDSVDIVDSFKQELQRINFNMEDAEVLKEFSKNVEKRTRRNFRGSNDKFNGKKPKRNKSIKNRESKSVISMKKNVKQLDTTDQIKSRKRKQKQNKVTNAKRMINLEGVEDLVRKKVHVENVNQGTNEENEHEAFNFIKVLENENNVSKEMDTKSTSPTCTDNKLETEEEHKTNNVGLVAKVTPGTNQIKLHRFNSDVKNSLNQQVLLIV